MAFRRIDDKSDTESDNNIHTFHRNTSNNDQNEMLSDFSNSDIRDFNYFEKNIYDSFENISNKNQHSHLHNDDKVDSDDVSDSLRLVLPQIPVRPSLGDAIQTYDFLCEQFNHEFSTKSKPVVSNISDLSQANDTSDKAADYNPRIGSRASVGSVEAIFSHNDKIEEPQKNVFKQCSTVSDTGNVKTRSRNSANQRALLFEERSIREDQDKYISHLQHTIDQLLTKHALAEETIDQLRLGAVINSTTRSGDKGPQIRSKSSAKRKSHTRCYSSIVDEAEYQNYLSENNLFTRAKSVDMSMLDEVPINNGFSGPRSLKDFGGSLHQISNRHPQNPDIATDIRTIGDYFQSRIRILTEVSSTLSDNISSQGSVSSGSQHGDSAVAGHMTYIDNNRHTPVVTRVKHLQMAFEDLQNDFNGFREINKKRNSEYPLLSEEELHDIEGDLFELGMKIDDIETQFGEGRVTPTNNTEVDGQDQYADCLTNTEEQYKSLMVQYNSLQGSKSANEQSQLDIVVRKLQSLVREAGGRHCHIPSPDTFQSMIQHDIVDKIKHHMTPENQPEYFLIEDDGLFSGHSSDVKGYKRCQGYRLPRTDLDSDYKSPITDFQSPTKSQLSMEFFDDELVQHKLQSSAAQSGLLLASTIYDSCVLPNATFSDPVVPNHRQSFSDSVFRNDRGSVVSETFPLNRNYNNTMKSIDSNNFGIGGVKSNGTASMSPPVYDNLRHLDEQFKQFQFDDKEQMFTCRNSSTIMTPRSTPAGSRASKLPSSAASSYKSYLDSDDQKQSFNNNRPNERPRRRRTKNRYSVPTRVTDSDSYGDDTASDVYDVVDCGLPRAPHCGNSARNQFQDRWSQTPQSFYTPMTNRKSNKEEYRSVPNESYSDNIARQMSSHPPRQSITGQPILRRPSEHARNIRNDNRTRSLYVPRDSDVIPRRCPDIRLSQSPYIESNVSREYYELEPHRYLVREYGERTKPIFDESMFEDDSDEDSSANESCSVDRRLRTYLDEAVKAAQTMKRYTKRLTNLYERRRYNIDDDNYSCSSSRQRINAQYS